MWPTPTNEGLYGGGGAQVLQDNVQGVLGVRGHSVLVVNQQLHNKKTQVT